MPNPKIDLKPFQGLITTWFNDGLSPNDIAKRLTEDHKALCKARTIERRLKDWGVTKRIRTQETVAPRLKIATMFYTNFSGTFHKKPEIGVQHNFLYIELI
jgi:hypothetical protein